MVYRALAGHCCPTDIYQAHMSGSAKSQQYRQRLKQAYSRTDGSWASGDFKFVPSVCIPTSLDSQLLANINGRDGRLPTVVGSWLMFSRAKIISMAFERPCCAERNVCKSVLGSGTVNCPFTLN